MNLRQFLYRAASALGWASAAARGPSALLSRVVRVEAYKATGRLLRALLPRIPR